MSWISRITKLLRKPKDGQYPSRQGVGIPEPMKDHRNIIDDTVQSFVDIKDPKDIAVLIGALDDAEFDVWYHAGRALVKLGGVSVPALLLSLQGTSRLKRRVIELLGDIDDSRTIEPLLVILQGHDPVEVELAAKALGRLNIRTPQALVPLFNGFYCSNNRVVRSNLDKALLGMGDYAVEPLVKMMSGADFDQANKAIELLGRLKSKLAVNPLIEHLFDDQQGVRVNVIAALAEMNDTRAINPLIQLFTDPDWHVREAAVTALCKMGDIALGSLKKVQKNDQEDPRMRAFALEVLLTIQHITPGVVNIQNKPGVIDVRTDADWQMDMEGQDPLDKESERIAQQLSGLTNQIELNGDFSSETKKEAVDLGQFLCENGGHLRMKRIAARAAYLGVSSRQLELWLNGICGWVA